MKMIEVSDNRDILETGCYKDIPYVTITSKYYEELVSGQLFLEALCAAGVDNWDGYEGACSVIYD